MGVLISSAVVPLTLTLLWSKQSKLAAAVSPIVGFAAAISTWLAVTKRMYGVITVDTTSQNMPMMAGNLVALFSPVLVTVVISLIKPDNFNFESTRGIKQVDDSVTTNNKEDKEADEVYNATNNTVETGADGPTSASSSNNNTISEEEMAFMNKSSRFAKMWSIVLSLALFILWPLPMYFSKYVFSKQFFTGWVVVSIIWVFISTIAVGIYPVYESRYTLLNIMREMWRDMTGKRVPNLPTTNEAAMISEENIVTYNLDKKANS